MLITLQRLVPVDGAPFALQPPNYPLFQLQPGFLRAPPSSALTSASCLASRCGGGLAFPASTVSLVWRAHLLGMVRVLVMKTRRRQTILFRPGNLRRQNSGSTPTRRNGALIVAGQSIGVEFALPLPDLPDRRRNVRCREKSGKHMLPLSISAFDPSRTFVGFPVNLCAHPVDPPMGLIGGITSWLLS